MGYLEKEIDEACDTLKINSSKLDSNELNVLVNSLTRKFFKSQENSVLDPTELNENAQSITLNFGKRCRIASARMV